ncbi:hypothetical protein NEOLI_000568 [Neolecta irregularis DAH-3]|uniref:CBF1-interacting co-repressor CIR N-terminal domain-containing protein n=1 Tax=Neolecta irregularis (strain DAH-3) TaxID=1198029 RepID=A0A1U7LKG6_NEOID|nr:hypothetical protein NEOLI_000568 [Neolecta irregularis DAH-3]|eukprot:OLL23144.1 hypothetical protein NEOLI_000568 [Neolecta irregularis DAH-3]
MPLNILHHKSWNVYNKDNIARVRADEEAARKKEEDEEYRMQEADKEHRLNILRTRAAESLAEQPNSIEKQASKSFLSEKKRKRVDDTAGLEDKRTPGLIKSHINFWGDLEDGKLAVGKKDYENPERQAEKKAEDEKWDSQITMRLGRPAKEMKPWYSSLDLESSEQKRTKEQRWERQHRNISFYDPLSAVNGFLKQKRQIEEDEREKEEHLRRDERDFSRKDYHQRRLEERDDQFREERRKSRDRHRHERQRRDLERRHTSKSPEFNLSSRLPSKNKNHHTKESSSLDIEKLRADRIARETAEKKRVEQLLRHDERVNIKGVGRAGYSAQFNPDFVR